MPLDQVLAADYDPAAAGEDGPGDAAARNGWEVPIGGPADLERMWAERQAARRMSDGG